jgi:PhzF family phenazine biosynthesis protein
MDAPNYFLVETFVTGPCSGNTTPVCVVDIAEADTNLQELAKTFNAAVSVFVSQAAGDLRIRYFTVSHEIPACGHGTLGAAYCLFGLKPDMETIVFQTIENRTLTATTDAGLTFVQYPKFFPKPIESQPAVLAALNIGSPKSQFFSPQLESLFIEVDTPGQVRSLSPNFEQLVSSSGRLKEVVVMSLNDQNESDIILRAFCPWVGIDEDPVTGSVHSVLGPYWQERLGLERPLRVFQASERGGTVIVASDADFVSIGGQCNLLVQGKLNP